MSSTDDAPISARTCPKINSSTTKVTAAKLFEGRYKVLRKITNSLKNTWVCAPCLLDFLTLYPFTNLLLCLHLFIKWEVSSVQFSSVAQSCLILCDPMNRSTPGLPVHHQLPEFTQTHIHLVSDAIQPSHPLSSPSPPAPNPSQHQSPFQWVNSLHEVAEVLQFQL